jgi:hypothetical protein
MYETIAYCGLDCSECDAYQATQADDLVLKEKIAERWTKKLGMAFTADDITCDGCKSERLSAWCQKVCVIRPCAEERGVITCAHCNDYSCKKVDDFLAGDPAARTTLEEIRKTLAP